MSNEEKPTITQHFDRCGDRLEHASKTLLQVRSDLTMPKREKELVEHAEALVEDADKALGQIRTALRGCWTEEARSLRETPLRVTNIVLASRADMLDTTIRETLPGLRNLRTELSDRPALADTLAEIIEAMECGLELFAVKPLTLGEVDKAVEAAAGQHALAWEEFAAGEGEGEEVGNRAELCRYVADMLEKEGRNPETSSRLRALADELENCDGCRSLWLRLNLKALDMATEGEKLTAAEYALARGEADRLFEEYDALEGDDSDQAKEKRERLFDQARTIDNEVRHKALLAIADGHTNPQLVAAAVIGRGKVEV